MRRVGAVLLLVGALVLSAAASEDQLAIALWTRSGSPVTVEDDGRLVVAGGEQALYQIMHTTSTVSPLQAARSLLLQGPAVSVDLTAVTYEQELIGLRSQHFLPGVHLTVHLRKHFPRDVIPSVASKLSALLPELAEPLKAARCGVDCEPCLDVLERDFAQATYDNAMLFFYAPLCPGAAISSPFSDEDPAIVTGRAPTTFHTKLSVAVDEADNRRLALKIVTHESGRLDASGAAVKPEQFDHVFVGEAAESDADTFHFTDMHSPEGGFKSATPRHGEVCVAREVEGTGMHRTLRTQVRISEKMAATCTGLSVTVSDILLRDSFVDPYQLRDQRPFLLLSGNDHGMLNISLRGLVELEAPASRGAQSLLAATAAASSTHRSLDMAIPIHFRYPLPGAAFTEVPLMPPSLSIMCPGWSAPLPVAYMPCDAVGPEVTFDILPTTVLQSYGALSMVVRVPAGDPELSTITTIVTLGVTFFGAVYLAEKVYQHAQRGEVERKRK